MSDSTRYFQLTPNILVEYNYNSLGTIDDMAGEKTEIIDLGNDADWLGNSSNSLRYSVPATSLSPVCFSCGTYCEHVFLTPFTQFENTCIMQINSKKYAYGGYLALEE